MSKHLKRQGAMKKDEDHTIRSNQPHARRIDTLLLEWGVRNAERIEEFKAQHGEVKILMKDGRPCQSQ